MRNVVELSMTKDHFFVPISHQKMAPDELQGIHEWLDKTPGEGYTLGGWGIYFYNEQDAVWFKLRWA